MLNTNYLFNNVKNYWVGTGLLIQNVPAVKDKEALKQKICYKFGITLQQIHSPKRKVIYVTARYMFYKIWQHEADYVSLKDLGAEFGQDHSTAIHGLKQIQNLIDTDEKIKRIYESIINSLK